MTDTYPHTFFVHHLHVVFHTYWIFIFGYLLFRSIIQNAIVLSPVKYEILWFVYLYTNWSKVLWARLKLFLLTVSQGLTIVQFVNSNMNTMAAFAKKFYMTFFWPLLFDIIIQYKRVMLSLPDVTKPGYFSALLLQLLKLIALC